MGIHRPGYFKEYHQKNKEKINRISKEWYWNNRERSAKKHKEYRERERVGLEKARKAYVAAEEGNMSKPMQPVYQAIGARIRMIRDAIGMSQAELSKRVNADGSTLNRPSFANIEAGRQRIMLHDVETIARALNCSTKHLLRGIWW